MSKFFTYEERLTLQKDLKESRSLKTIAKELNKNPTTVSREIMKYSSEVATGDSGYPYNACKNRIHCRKKNICLLTIRFVESGLMLAFLREANTSQSVIDIFNALDKVLGADLFEKLFPVILTDNGSEFSNPKAIEYRETVLKGVSYQTYSTQRNKFRSLDPEGYFCDDESHQFVQKKKAE